MDETILLWIQEHIRNPYLDQAVIFITHLGDAGWFWIVLAFILLLFVKTRRAGAVSAIALLCSLIINNGILKNAVARVRPYEQIEELALMIEKQVDFSFPSGHSAASFAAATAIYLNLPKRYGIPALLLAALIALSRLYVGVHYPTDVLFGVISGIGCALLAQLIYKFIHGKCQEKTLDT